MVDTAFSGHVLLLEDDIELAIDYSEYLTAAGFAVTVARSGADALHLAAGERFDVAVVDMFIRKAGQLVPDGGLSLIFKLRNSSGLRTPRNVPVLAISGSALTRTEPSPLQAAMTVGATSTMVKPIDAFELVDEVNRLVSDLNGGGSL